MNSKQVKRKINLVSLKQKYDAVVSIDKKEKNLTYICTYLDVKKITVYGWIKKKEEIVESMRKTQMPNVLKSEVQNMKKKTALLEWFKEARSSKCAIDKF
ncbi:unnamed protein product [Brachionus calyciflorus]|uniref:HTH psq-type domain-containing protein n=1 Tax=Brachionus calyciflorus TaxID=104777 RepID=A0A813NXP8_9BILA|nr:unnamed protein product [Brachionus calyciflorus]